MKSYIKTPCFVKHGKYNDIKSKKQFFAAIKRANLAPYFKRDPTYNSQHIIIIVNLGL